MTRNLRALGLALVAVFVMSAWMASAASAHTPAKFTVEVEESTLRSEETVTNILSVTGVETFCEVVSYHGVSPAGTVSAEALTSMPSYSECKAESIIGTVNATVTGFKAGECEYRIRANQTADLECAAGKEVTVDAGPCTIHIPPQSGLGTITFTTEIFGNGIHDLLVHINFSNLTTNHTDGFGCPLPSGGESATATAVGTTTAWAESTPGTKVNLTWDATVA